MGRTVAVAGVVEEVDWFEVSVLGALCLSANSLSWNGEGGRVKDKAASSADSRTTKTQGRNTWTTTTSQGPNGNGLAG